ncbi:MAG TPA: HNH endonuclease, partial [Vicinamibacteria bacterium]|nr:HNH endonuclease [Vicinamibacteria bacterium]
PAAAVKRAVWARDAGRCAYVSAGGRRCTERGFLEFHHVQPYALRGEATIDNIALRCRRHNQYEALMMFGEPARAQPAQDHGQTAGA